MAWTQFWRWLVCLPPALLLMAESLPHGVLAGSGPLDNNGRIPCDPSGLIASSWKKDPGLPSAAELQPGAMATVPAVCPAERYFPTGVWLTPGATYQIEAQGLWQDGWIRVGPTGWPGLLLQAWNRLPWRPFFVLGGAIGRSEAQLFAIGRSRRWTAPATLNPEADRQLYLFANDWPGKLPNNRSVADDKGGPLRVSITRLP